MSLDRYLSEKDGVFQSTANLQASSPLVGNIVITNVSGIVTLYSVDASDLGGGLLLANGNYANPTALELQTDKPNNQTGIAYTLALTDSAKTVWMNNAASNTLTIPANAIIAFPVNTLILIMMEGAGVTSITATAGVTLNTIVAGSGDLTQFNGVTLVKRDTDTWIATPLTVA